MANKITQADVVNYLISLSQVERKTVMAIIDAEDKKLSLEKNYYLQTVQNVSVGLSSHLRNVKKAKTDYRGKIIRLKSLEVSDEQREELESKLYGQLVQVLNEARSAVLANLPSWLNAVEKLHASRFLNDVISKQEKFKAWNKDLTVIKKKTNECMKMVDQAFDIYGNMINLSQQLQELLESQGGFGGFPKSDITLSPHDVIVPEAV